MTGPQAALLGDGRRVHFQHGPIDLIIEAFGPADAVRAAYGQAWARFQMVLEELVAELPLLRGPADPAAPLRGRVARRMQAAVCRHLPLFITPMAAVAGAVADEVLAALVAGLPLERAYVNDGGDVALFLTPGTRIDAAIWAEGDAGRATIRAEDPIRGLATSGWRGRSHSLGIADAVTVLARCAAGADAAATLIANAVDLPAHPAIDRAPARELAPDSDLGDRLVTTGVGRLTPEEVAEALGRGALCAEAMRGSGLIEAAALFLAGQSRIVGALPLSASEGALIRA
ncbi:MAG TPA: UPF0280 family protein [Paracoccaceae bacterium]|nr:UPF0280 family protein [Paracoccaceae bacterium]